MPTIQRRLFHIISFLLITLATTTVFAQTTSVTIQATDADGQTWNNGTWAAQLLPASGITGPFFIKGTTTPVPNNLGGALNGSGSATATFTSTTNIAPAGTQWQITVCPQATSVCFTQSTTIQGASQNVTINPPAIRISLTAPTLYTTAYQDIELANPPIGGQYFNLTSLSYRVWTGISWTTATGAFNAGANLRGDNTNQFITSIGRTSILDSPSCVVDGVVHPNIASCITFLNNTFFGGTCVSNCINGGTIWSNIPEEFTTQVLQNFTGRIYLNNSTQTTGIATPTTAWLTCIPLILPSRLNILGTGVAQKTNLSQGTVIGYDEGCFPSALGAPVAPTLNMGAIGTGGIATGPVIVALEEVNNAMGGTTTPRTPMYSRANVQVLQVTNVSTQINFTNCVSAAGTYTLSTASTGALANGNLVQFSQNMSRCTALDGLVLAVSNVVANTSFQVTTGAATVGSGAESGFAILGSSINFTMPGVLGSSVSAYNGLDLSIMTTTPTCWTATATTGCTNISVSAAEATNKMTFNLTSATLFGNTIGAGSHVVVTGCSVAGYNSVNSITGDWVVRTGGGSAVNGSSQGIFTVYNPLTTGLGAATGCNVYVENAFPVQNVSGVDLTCSNGNGNASSGDPNACKLPGTATITAVAPQGTDNTRNTMWWGQVDGSNPELIMQRGVWANTNGSYDDELRDLTISSLNSVDQSAAPDHTDNNAPNCPGITLLLSNGEEQSGYRGVGFHGGCAPPPTNGLTQITPINCSAAANVYTITTANTLGLVNTQIVQASGFTHCPALNGQNLNVSSVVANTSFQVTLNGSGTITSAGETGVVTLGGGPQSVGVAVYSGASNSHLIETTMGSSDGANIGQYYGIIIDGFRKTFAAARWLIDSSVNPHCSGCTGSTTTIQPTAVAVVGNFQGTVANPQVDIQALHAEVFSVGGGMGTGSNSCVLVAYGASTNVDGLGCSGGNANAIEGSATAGNISFQNVWGGGTNDFCDDSMGICYASNTSRAHSGANDFGISALGNITAPAPVTISSGFGTSPSIVGGSPLAFQINVGGGGAATSGVIGLPTAKNGWVVKCDDVTTPNTNVTRQTASTTTTATLTNYNWTSTPAAWTASDKLNCSATAY